MKTGPIFRAKQIKALKHFYKSSFKQSDKWAANGYKYPAPESIPYPEICRDMRCEAKTRSGAPCKNDGASWGNGRCKFHGGASTDPVKQEGKKRVSMNSSTSRTI